MGIWIQEYKNSGEEVNYTNDDRFHNVGCESDYILAHYQGPRLLLCLWEKLQREHQPICCEWQACVNFIWCILHILYDMSLKRGCYCASRRSYRENTNRYGVNDRYVSNLFDEFYAYCMMWVWNVEVAFVFSFFFDENIAAFVFSFFSRCEHSNVVVWLYRLLICIVTIGACKVNVKFGSILQFEAYVFAV